MQTVKDGQRQQQCDIYGIFVEAQQSDHPADFVIRAKASRSLPQRDLEAGPAAYRKARDAVL